GGEAAERNRMAGDDPERRGKDPAERDERAGPEEAAERAEDHEPAERHPDDARQRRGDRAEARDELGDHQGAWPVFGEDRPGAPDARIGLERDAAEPAEYFRAAEPADDVPGHVGDERGDTGQE